MPDSTIPSVVVDDGATSYSNSTTTVAVTLQR